MRLTKNGNPRSKKRKANITQRRYFFRFMVWRRLQWRLRKHILSHPRGEARTMSRALGVSQSQVHRWVCEKCNHDQEPSFSTGFAIALYLAQARVPTYDA